LRAGVVLAATFAVLGSLPLVPSVQTGVVVAVGVLLDRLLVRGLLPALALQVGRAVWWRCARIGRSGWCRRGRSRSAPAGGGHPQASVAGHVPGPPVCAVAGAPSGPAR
jgi:uncharacterized membrane protein YdfJ with MMPL/SSD domain